MTKQTLMIALAAIAVLLLGAGMTAQSLAALL